jgi:hypothetical protein
MKSKKGIFVGFGENTKGYKIHLPDTDKVTLERDVVFVPEKEGEQYIEYEGSDLSPTQNEERDNIKQELTEVQNDELDEEAGPSKQQQNGHAAATKGKPSKTLQVHRLCHSLFWCH